MQCSKCGSENTVDSNYCIQCGVELSKDSQYEYSQQQNPVPTKSKMPTWAKVLIIAVLAPIALIILGLVIVAGIKSFGTSESQANEDAVVQECLSTIYASQQWVRKPHTMGGPVTMNDFTNFDFSIIGKAVPTGTTVWTNANGDVFTISARGMNTMTLTGVGREGVRVVYAGVNAGAVPPVPTITR